jgi:hypothetical protein
MGRRGVYPPVFCEEWGSGLESEGCGWAENKCVQVIGDKGVAGTRVRRNRGKRQRMKRVWVLRDGEDSNREGEFTE